MPCGGKGVSGGLAVASCAEVVRGDWFEMSRESYGQDYRVGTLALAEVSSTESLNASSAGTRRCSSWSRSKKENEHLVCFSVGAAGRSVFGGVSSGYPSQEDDT